jgi:hypothetical protein
MSENTTPTFLSKTYHTAIVGFGAGWEAHKEGQCGNAGITDLLVSPVTLKKCQDCVDRAIHKMRDTAQENLLAFLPAKAASGCTTVALNLAGYLADTSAKDSLGKRVLLIEWSCSRSWRGISGAWWNSRRRRWSS